MVMRAFADKMQIEICENRQKGVWVIKFCHGSLVRLYPYLIGKNVFLFRKDNLEETVPVNSLHLIELFRFQIDYPCFFSFRQKGTYGYRFLPIFLHHMIAENLKRVPVAGLYDQFYLVFQIIF